MELHSDVVKKHDVFKLLDETIQLCETIMSDSISLADNVIAEINRISYILIELKSLLSEFNDSFISITRLNNLRTHILNLKNFLNSFKNGKNESNLQNAQSTIDSLIDLTNLNQYYFNKKKPTYVNPHYSLC